MSRLKDLALDSGKESIVLTAIAVPVAYPFFVFFRTGYPDAFGFALLVEACLLMLAGGALDIGSTGSAKRIYSAIARKRFEYDREESQKLVTRAAVYTLTGVILFVESLGVAIALAA